MGRISDDLLLNPKTNTNGANNLTEWRNFDGTRHSEKLNQITLADMEFPIQPMFILNFRGRQM